MYILLDNRGIAEYKEFTDTTKQLLSKVTAVSNKAIIAFSGDLPTSRDLGDLQLSDGQILYHIDSKTFYKANVSSSITTLTEYLTQKQVTEVDELYKDTDNKDVIYNKYTEKYYYVENDTFTEITDQDIIDTLTAVQQQRTVQKAIIDPAPTYYDCPVFVTLSGDYIYYLAPTQSYYYLSNGNLYTGSLNISPVMENVTEEHTLLFYIPLEVVPPGGTTSYVYTRDSGETYYREGTMSVYSGKIIRAYDTWATNDKGYHLYKDSQNNIVYYDSDNDIYVYESTGQEYEDIEYSFSVSKYNLFALGDADTYLSMKDDSSDVEWRESYILDEVSSITTDGTKQLVDKSALINWNGSVVDKNNVSHNNITKLGAVDEGTWDAGDVTAPNIEATTKVTAPEAEINKIIEDMLDIGSSTAGFHELTTGVVKASGLYTFDNITASGIEAGSVHTNILSGREAVLSSIEASSIKYNNSELNTLLSGKISISEKAAANGVATLDINGRIPYSQLPEDSVELKGKWNVSTNTPDISSLTPTLGDMYIVETGGTSDITGTTETYYSGDRIICVDSTVPTWVHTRNAGVYSVNNKAGEVVLTADDIEYTSGVTVTSGINARIPASEKGAANGVAPLNSSGKVSKSILDVLDYYQGLWNVPDNLPTLYQGCPYDSNNNTFIVSVAGTSNLTGTSEAYAIGDIVYYNGTAWVHIPNGAVASVNGKTGAVALTGEDIARSSTDNTTISNTLDNIEQSISSMSNVVAITQAEYNALATIDPDVLYVIVS